MLLKGITVIELAGLAPAPFCGMILSDFGARVIRVDKPRTPEIDNMGRGKQSIVLDLKQQSSVSILKRLCKRSDVLLEPFRPGVMEKLGLGPDVLTKDNPKLIYARLSGYGQTGDMALHAGHDINYIATSGLLSRLGRKGQRPSAPINLLADFAGGGLICALGIVMALYERTNSGTGQVIDANMVQGSAYIGSWLDSAKRLFFSGDRGTNLLDGGSAFYDTYETSDGKHMAVGSLEPQFYNALLKGLGLDAAKVTQGDDQNEQRKLFQSIFSTKTRDEWTQIFSKLDACVTPVLSQEEASQLPHNKNKNTFLEISRTGEPTFLQAAPSPLFSRTPSDSSKIQKLPFIGEHTLQVLSDFGYSQQELKDLVSQGAIQQRGKL